MNKTYLILGAAVAILIGLGGVGWKAYSIGYANANAACLAGQAKAVDTKVDIKGKQDEIRNNRPSVVRLTGRLRAHSF